MIQVGVGKDGNLYHFDTGSASHGNKWSNEDNNSQLSSLYQRHGAEREYLPFGAQAERNLENFHEMANNPDWADLYPHDSPEHMKHFANMARHADAARRGILRDQPERAGELNQQFAKNLHRVGLNPAEYGLPAAEKPASAKPLPAGVPGAQMGLFGQAGGGQKQLFNVAMPGKKKAKPMFAEAPIKTESPLDALVPQQVTPLEGQKAMFSLTDVFNRAMYSYVANSA
jgi:hypothetical protein